MTARILPFVKKIVRGTPQLSVSKVGGQLRITLTRPPKP